MLRLRKIAARFVMVHCACYSQLRANPVRCQRSVLEGKVQVNTCHLVAGMRPKSERHVKPKEVGNLRKANAQIDAPLDGGILAPAQHILFNETDSDDHSEVHSRAKF